MTPEKIKALIVNILTVVVVLGVVVAAFFIFTKKDIPVVGDTAASVATVAKIAEETALIGTEIDYTVRDLGNLARAVESSNALFDLPAFKNLQDFTVPIFSQAIGRANPFLPTDWKLKFSALEGSAGKTAAPVAPVIAPEVPASSTPAVLSGEIAPGI